MDVHDKIRAENKRIDAWQDPDKRTIEDARREKEAAERDHHKLSTHNTVKQGMAHTLVQQATFYLQVAQRLRGDAPEMPMQAEFQSIDLTRVEFDRLMIEYRAVLREA